MSISLPYFVVHQNGLYITWSDEPISDEVIEVESLSEHSHLILNIKEEDKPLYMDSDYFTNKYLQTQNIGELIILVASPDCFKETTFFTPYRCRDDIKERFESDESVVIGVTYPTDDGFKCEYSLFHPKGVKKLFSTDKARLDVYDDNDVVFMAYTDREPEIRELLTSSLAETSECEFLEKQIKKLPVEDYICSLLKKHEMLDIEVTSVIHAEHDDSYTVLLKSENHNIRSKKKFDNRQHLISEFMSKFGTFFTLRREIFQSRFIEKLIASLNNRLGFEMYFKNSYHNPHNEVFLVLVTDFYPDALFSIKLLSTNSTTGFFTFGVANRGLFLANQECKKDYFVLLSDELFSKSDEEKCEYFVSEIEKMMKLCYKNNIIVTPESLKQRGLGMFLQNGAVEIRNTETSKVVIRFNSSLTNTDCTIAFSYEVFVNDRESVMVKEKGGKIYNSFDEYIDDNLDEAITKYDSLTNPH